MTLNHSYRPQLSGNTSMTRQQITATTPAICSATIACSLIAFFNAFFLYLVWAHAELSNTSEISFTQLWGFLSKRLFLFLSIILSFCFFVSI